jgi:hypothetical protein
MAERYPVVLVHGYSDKGASFGRWKEFLAQKGYLAEEISICNYESLTNEVTIKDIAEGFDRALRTQAHLATDQPFSAIVHSTGMLVIRSWLTTYEARRGRLKHLIALAPATFGSPLAHQGRSLLGALIKGNRVIGPDFMEAGDLILDGLELGSRFTWDLAHQDILSDQPYYGSDPDSPYVYIFCGASAYTGLNSLVNQPGTDGTVRWAGCALNTRKITIDLSREPPSSKQRDEAAGGAPPTLDGQQESGTGPGSPSPIDPEKTRVSGSRVAEGLLPMPFWPIEGKNHGTILSDPGPILEELVFEALQARDAEAFAAWQQNAEGKTKPAKAQIEEWQQFVVRMVDERGDPIQDYHLELYTVAPDGTERAFGVELDEHAYAADKSFRCLHVNLTTLLPRLAALSGHELWVRVIASSGSTLVGYHGVRSEKFTEGMKEMDSEGKWDAKIRLELNDKSGMTLFYPFTTTFVEIKLNRDPIPFGEGPNRLVNILP